MSLQVLTTTGGRPEAFGLCVEYMRRQTYTEPVRWVIVDDGEPGIDAPTMPANWSVEVMRTRPAWQPGQNTQARNLRAGLLAIDGEVPLVIVEDDDWYSPAWLQTCADALTHCELFGEAGARYYHVRRRVARNMGNVAHASLCSTATRGRATQALFDIAARHASGIDMRLWRECRVPAFLTVATHVVGIKGMPGRGGIGVGHRETFAGDRDDGLSKLRAWIGDDAERYACFKS